MHPLHILSCALLFAFTTLTESTLIDDLNWDLQVRQELSSVQFDSTTAFGRFASSEIATSIASVMSSSVDETPTSFVATSDTPASTPAQTTTSVNDTPTTTSAVLTTSTSIPASTAAGGATTTQGSPSLPSTTSGNTPEAISNGNNGSSDPGASTTPAASTAASDFANGLGTTTSDGTLIVATTNSRGQTTTLVGADASSATRAVHTYTSALLGTSHSLATFRTTRVVDGSTSIGDATSSVPITLTTGMVTATNAAELANGGSNSNSRGLSASDKKTIGGVVGGVGGALLIGGILLVLWRLRKKKNDMYNEDDDYPENEYTKEQKRISRGSQQAFSDGLERYHNPTNPANMNVNTSSNF